MPTGVLLGLAGFVIASFSMAEPTLLAYAEDALGAGVAGYGWLFAAWGAGAVVGSGIYAKLLDRSVMHVWAGAVALCGIGYMGYGFAPSLAVACALGFVGGVGNGIDWAAISTAIQESAPRSEQVRVAARIETLVTGAPVVGFALGGVLASVLPVRYTLVLPGALCVTLAVAVVLHLSLGTGVRSRTPVILANARGGA